MNRHRWFLIATLLFLAANPQTQASSPLDAYVRAREFAMRFANVISSTDEITYTLGRDDRQSTARAVKVGETIPRLVLKSGSRTITVERWRDGQLSSSRKVTLERGIKVGSNGLLLPVQALRYLNCTARAKPGSSTLLVRCDGISYELQRFAP